MSKKKVLIITHSQDNVSVDMVTKYIEEAGGEVIRFNSDQYPMQAELTSKFSGEQYEVLYNDGTRTHNLSDLESVWYRRSYNLGSGLSEAIEKEFLQSTLGEVKRTLHGMIDGLSCFHLERFSMYRRLDSKEEQLRVAVRNGLKIPPTCVTNSPTQLKEFVAQVNAPVITKMQSSFAIYREQEEHVVFTNEIKEEDLNDMETLKYCPMVFQQKIEKKLELRITIVGDTVFAFSIDSQKLSNAKVDWRKEGLKLIKDWKPYTLPERIKAQLLAFMDDYGINYGAIDVLVTPNNEYYFLEINAAGEFFWLDKLCDHAISKQIAAVLLNDAPRR